MTIAYYCVLIGAFLPVIFAGLAKSSRRGYDNAAPRQFTEQLEGWGRRANWAQQNAFEAYPFFVAMVLIAHQLQVDQQWLNLLAIGWVVFRILHGVTYILDYATMRSLAWTGAVACNIAMFVLAARVG